MPEKPQDSERTVRKTDIRKLGNQQLRVEDQREGGQIQQQRRLQKANRAQEQNL